MRPALRWLQWRWHPMRSLVIFKRRQWKHTKHLIAKSSCTRTRLAFFIFLLAKSPLAFFSRPTGNWYLTFCRPCFYLVMNERVYQKNSYFNANPKVYGLIFLFSFVGYMGILFVLSMVKSYGALLAVTVTTFRKALSIIISFIFFTKPFTIQYVWSGLIVLLGISLNIFK